MAGADVLGVDARAVYAQLLAIASRARQVRQAAEPCSADDVDGILEAYAATRTLCHELTCGEKVAVCLPDLGRIAKDKQHTTGDLRAMLTIVEIECFKCMGALVKIITLIPKEEAHQE